MGANREQQFQEMRRAIGALVYQWNTFHSRNFWQRLRWLVLGK